MEGASNPKDRLHNRYDGSNGRNSTIRPAILGRKCSTLRGQLERRTDGQAGNGGENAHMCRLNALRRAGQGRRKELLRAEGRGRKGGRKEEGKYGASHISASPRPT